MPSAVPEAPTSLVALVYDFLKTSGFNKSAKALKKEFDEELEDVVGKSLLEIFQNSNGEAEGSKKKRKAEKVEKEDEKEEEEEEKPKKSKKSKKEKMKEASDEEEEEKPAEKKDKASKKKAQKEEKKEDEEEEEEEEEAQPKTESVSPAKSKKGGGGQSTPFKRIKEEDVSYLKVKGGHGEVERLRDNTFESKGGDVYGAKASAILETVRGKDFRHEKNKKKKGTYKGGPIDLNSNSIKFVDSDDE